MALPYSHEQWVEMGNWVHLDDGKVFYVRKGRGFPVILMHQYGGNSWWFSRVIDALAQCFTVYAMDLPGCAQSETPPLPYGPPEYAAALQEFMNGLGIERAHLVGSHGSALTSAHFAATCYGRVARMVMDGTPPWNRLEGKRYWREVMRPKWVDENELPRPFDQRRWDDIEAPFAGLEEADRRTATLRANSDHAAHGKWWVTILKQALKYDVYSRLNLIQAPTLVVNGEKEWGRRSEERLLNGIVGSRLAVISGAGAIPAFEQPDAWTRVVLDFLVGG